MANARIRNGSLGVLNAQSPWLSAKRGMNIKISGTFVGTVALVRRDANGNTFPVTGATGTAVTFTGPVNYSVANPFVQGDYALQMTAYTSGTAVTAMEGW